MTKEDIVTAVASVATQVEALQVIVPANYDEYNSLRLQYDTLQMRLQGYQLQLQAIVLSEQMLSAVEAPVE